MAAQGVGYHRRIPVSDESILHIPAGTRVYMRLLLLARSGAMIPDVLLILDCAQEFDTFGREETLRHRNLSVDDRTGEEEDQRRQPGRFGDPECGGEEVNRQSGEQDRCAQLGR